MANIIKIEYRIEAGKYDGDEINYKYLDTADSSSEALEKYKSCQGYPYSMLWLYIEYDDNTLVRSDLNDPTFVRTFRWHPVLRYWIDIGYKD